jgi:hypothetical protein
MSTTLKVLPRALHDNGGSRDEYPPTLEDLNKQVHEQVAELLLWSMNNQGVFAAFEKELWSRLHILGRLLLMVFLAARDARLCRDATLRIDEQIYRRRDNKQARNLETLFGPLRYFRSYYRADKGGVYPLDTALGLLSDRLSLNLLSLGARLCTMMSYAKARGTLCFLLGQAPSTEVLEQTVLGLGARTGAWFEKAPAPKDDGTVLIIQIDSKGPPCATEEELARRRGKRGYRPAAPSPRHRGRHKREFHHKPERRQPGDKSKNAKMVTLVKMYTLRPGVHQGEAILLGPINPKVYASFSNKRHAFEIARREADKRGFSSGSGRQIQILTDGDQDFARYAKELFPEAIHTVDIIHVIEYLWRASECLFRANSSEQPAWVAEHKEMLYQGQEALVVQHLRRRLEAIPSRGPGNKGKRDRLGQIIAYLDKRLPLMNYKALIEQDLELATGAGEGAVKNIIGARFDIGGSRWIPERAEALLHLRCIEHNGDWDTFIQWVHDEHLAASQKRSRPNRLQQGLPAPLPSAKAA